MDVLQAWILIGVPGVVIAAALFVGRSVLRARLGYVVLAGLIVTFMVIPGGGVSAALIGAIGVVAVAIGRGTHLDRTSREHHQERSRFTTAS